MCGRFSVLVDYLVAKEQYLAKVRYEFKPNYNVAPGQNVPVIVAEDGQNIVDGMKWGFIPHWAKDPSIGFKMINARSETVHEKPSFKKSFEERRCLILSSGFFEWKKEGSQKTPFFFRIENKPLISFAGLWSEWKSPEGQEVKSCTIITTEPNKTVRAVHDRMPVILTQEGEKTWLGNNNKDLKQVLKPYPEKHMKSYEVSKLVNYSKNNSPEVIKEINSEKTLMDY